MGRGGSKGQRGVEREGVEGVGRTAMMLRETGKRKLEELNKLHGLKMNTLPLVTTR